MNTEEVDRRFSRIQITIGTCRDNKGEELAVGYVSCTSKVKFIGSCPVSTIKNDFSHDWDKVLTLLWPKHCLSIFYFFVLPRAIRLKQNSKKKIVSAFDILFNCFFFFLEHHNFLC